MHVNDFKSIFKGLIQTLNKCGLGVHTEKTCFSTQDVCPLGYITYQSMIS